MSEKRRDNKNRILRSGESQRKDGRYAYKYTDTFGKVQFVYAWKLVPTDKTPAGKRDDISLREKKKEIQKDLDDGIDTIGKKMTVCELYAKQNRHRGNVRHNTTKGRERLMKLLEADKLGSCPIALSDIGFVKNDYIRSAVKGLALGLSMFAIGYFVEILILMQNRTYAGIRFYVSAYAVDTNIAKQTSVLFGASIIHAN